MTSIFEFHIDSDIDVEPLDAISRESKEVPSYSVHVTRYIKR